MCVCPHICTDAWGRPERDALKLELHIVVSHLMCPGDWAPVLWKSSKCSSVLSRLSSPITVSSNGFLLGRHLYRAYVLWGKVSKSMNVLTVGWRSSATAPACLCGVWSFVQNSATPPCWLFTPWALLQWPSESGVWRGTSLLELSIFKLSCALTSWVIQDCRPGFVMKNFTDLCTFLLL